MAYHFSWSPMPLGDFGFGEDLIEVGVVDVG